VQDVPDMSILNEIIRNQYEAMQLNDDVWYRKIMGTSVSAARCNDSPFEESAWNKITPILNEELDVKKYLVIIDDNLESLWSYNSDLALFGTKSRHYNIVTIYTTQVFRRLPSTIWQNCDISFYLYLTVSDNTFDELFNKKKLVLFNQFYEDYVRKGPQYSFICANSNPSVQNDCNMFYEYGDTRKRMWIEM